MLSHLENGISTVVVLAEEMIGGGEHCEVGD